MTNRLIKAIDSIIGRSFVLGDAVVDPAMQYHGVASETFAPQEYGDYIATSTYVNVCATLRARLLSGLPLRVYKGNPSDRDEVESGPLYDLLHKVNPYWTMDRLLNMTELSLCLWGSCFWFVERAGGQAARGIPKQIWWGRPDRVRVHPHPTDYISGFTYTSGNGGQEIYYPAHQVIWIRYANPLDEFSGLSPLAGARLSADTASAAMRSNRNIFANGTNMGGIVTPVGDNGRQGTFDADTATELTNILGKKLKGVDNAHRVAVLRFDARFQSLQMSPKDAEFLGLMKLTMEDIARVYGVPLDLIGGQRTYENYESAQRAIWTQTMVPEARFIASELTEQLLPMFPGMADMIEFDISDVDVLQESKDAEWARWDQQLKAGVRVPNEWREEQGLPAVEWGDVWWAPANLLPIGQGSEDLLPAPVIKVLDPPAPEGEPLEEDDPEEEDDEIIEAEFKEAAERLTTAHNVEYGSEAHKRAWQALMRRVEPHERKIHRAVADLMHRQRQSYVGKIKQGILPDTEGKAERGFIPPSQFFDKSRWNKRFRVEIKPIINDLAHTAAQGALDDLGLNVAFDVTDPNYVTFLEGRTQRFAERVNDTTWEWLQKAIGQDIKQGNTVDKIAEHVDILMGDRIRSSAQTIARTESIGAMNGGTLLSWEQSGQVETKQWLAGLDNRTRASHVKAHGQTVPLNANF